MKKLWGFLIAGLVVILTLTGCNSVSIRNKTDVEATGDFKTMTYEASDAEKLTIKDIYIKDSFVNVSVKSSTSKNITILAQESVLEDIKVNFLLGHLYIEANAKNRYVTDSINVIIEGYQFSDVSTECANISCEANTLIDGFSGSFASVSSAALNLSNITKISNISASGVSQVSLNNVRDLSSMKLDLSGCSHFYCENSNIEKLEAEISGASSASITGKFTKLAITLSGASQLEMTGNASNAEYNISGSSKLKAKELEVVSVDTVISGASEVTIACTDDLEYHISGASALSYAGNPTISKGSSISGASVVKTI